MIFIYGQSIITEIPNTSIKEKEEKIYEMGGLETTMTLLYEIVEQCKY